jgi:hypothetical protein
VGLAAADTETALTPLFTLATRADFELKLAGAEVYFLGPPDMSIRLERFSLVHDVEVTAAGCLPVPPPLTLVVPCGHATRNS